jgi:hypothetical protein
MNQKRSRCGARDHALPAREIAGKRIYFPARIKRPWSVCRIETGSIKVMLLG